MQSMCPNPLDSLVPQFLSYMYVFKNPQICGCSSMSVGRGNSGLAQGKPVSDPNSEGCLCSVFVWGPHPALLKI